MKKILILVLALGMVMMTSGCEMKFGGKSALGGLGASVVRDLDKEIETDSAYGEESPL